MNVVISLALKDLRLMLRDRVGAFFTFIFPVLYASLFGVIMSGFNRTGGGGIGLRIALVDEDATAGSQAFARELISSREFDVLETDDRAAAAELVRLGRRTAYVLLPPGFGARRENLFSGNPPTIETGIDPARRAEAAMLEGLLTAQLFEGLQDVFTDPDKMNAMIDRALADIDASDQLDGTTAAALRLFLPAVRSFVSGMPVEALSEGGGGFARPRIESRPVTRQSSGPRSSYEISFPQGVVWGIMGCAAGFGISLVIERTRGTLVRLRSGPLGRAQILAGKGLACLVTTLTVSVVLLAFAYVVFGVRADSYVKLALALACVAACFVGVMMMLSVLGRTEQSAGGIGWAILTVMAMIGGGMIPLVFLPDWMQTFAGISPIKWSILALEGAIWRGFSYGELAVPCAILLLIGAGCFAGGVRMFRWTN